MSTAETRTLTHADLLAEAKGRFGEDPLGFAFKCPRCGDVAKVGEFEDADAAGQECIGRQLGALSFGYAGRGCDWAAFGLIPGPWTVVMPDGREVRSFPLAPAPEVTEAAS
jgi:hypothetical protein